MSDIVYVLPELTLLVLGIGGVIGWWFVKHHRPRRRARRAAAAQRLQAHMAQLTRRARAGDGLSRRPPGPRLFRRILAQRGLRHPDETPPMPRAVFFGVVAGVCIGPLASRFMAQDLALWAGVAALPITVAVVLWLDRRRARRRPLSEHTRSRFDVF